MSHKYRNSIAAAVAAIYPDVKWKTWRFQRAPKSFWKQKTNQRAFLDDCAERLGLKDPLRNEMDLAKWYEVDQQDISVMDGSTLLSIHQGSLIHCLAYAYSEHEWQEWLFTKINAPRGFWDSPANRRRYTDWLSRERLGFDPVRDWHRFYKLTHDDFHRNHGGALIYSQYGDSVKTLVMDIYPERAWLEWKFERTPQGWWANAGNQRKFLLWFAETHNLENSDDWYRTPLDAVREAGGAVGAIATMGTFLTPILALGASLLHMYGGSLEKCLQQCFPDRDWQAWKFNKVPSGTFTNS